MTDLALVLEPDGSARQALALTLTQAGYRVVCAVSSGDALVRASIAPIDLVIADSSAVNAIDAFINRIRQLRSCPAVIILDAEPSATGAVAAFRSGAFDYLAKFSEPEAVWEAVAFALARRARERHRDELIGAVGERLSALFDLLTASTLAQPSPEHDSGSNASTPGSAELLLVVGRLQLARGRREAFVGGRGLTFTPIEHRLLLCLAERLGSVCSYAELARYTHGYEIGEPEAMALLKTHVRNLRRKLPAGYLVSERGIGYRLVVPATDQVVDNAENLKMLAIGEGR